MDKQLNNNLGSRLSLKNNRGSLFVISLLLISILLVLGAALVVISSTDSRIAERQRRTIQAFHVAEAGIEQAIYYLRRDFLNDPSSPSWGDGDINGINVSGFYVSGQPPAGYYPLLNGSLNGGTYNVELKNVGGTSRSVWAKSTGVVGGVTQTILIYARINSISPWDNAIFAGRGSAANAKAINGSVDINGSVHILGTDLPDGAHAVELGGTAELIGNNYVGLLQSLKDKVPVLPTMSYGGETVETLSAELRVKNGDIILDGNSSVGQVQQTGNAYKEMIDGVYVTDGFGGNSGITNVHSDNGWSNSYDLGDTVGFPRLSDSYPGYASYQAYLRAHALVVNSAADLTKLASLNPNSTSFSITDVSNGYGSISWDNTTKTLAVNGIVYIEGGDLGMQVAGNDKNIYYSGTGSIFATGNIVIETNLETIGNNSFPTNIIGFMTPQNIQLGTSTASINAMGLFYAQNQITVGKQTNVMGTLVADYFDMGSQVPKIYQVPEAANNLPPGLIGQSANYSMRIVSWQKI
jgi:hypothetical protein